MVQPIGRMNREMLGQTLRAESTAVDRMLRIAFDGDRSGPSRTPMYIPHPTEQ
jgi:hypothetical protein